MDLIALIERPSDIPMQEEEVYFILKEYVKIRKEVEINPKIKLGLNELWNMHEANLMHKMLDHSIGWLRNNKDKI